jgi:hypothetical protein
MGIVYESGAVDFWTDVADRARNALHEGASGIPIVKE